MNLKGFLTAGLFALTLTAASAVTTNMYAGPEDDGKAENPGAEAEQNTGNTTIVSVDYDVIRNSAVFKAFIEPKEAGLRKTLTEVMKNQNGADLPIEKRVELTANVQAMQMLPQMIAQKKAPQFIKDMKGAVAVLPKGVSIASKGVSDIAVKIVESLKKEEIEGIFEDLVKKTLTQMQAQMPVAAEDKKGADKGKPKAQASAAAAA